MELKNQKHTLAQKTNKITTELLQNYDWMILEPSEFKR